MTGHTHTHTCVRQWPIGSKFRHNNVLYTKTGNAPGIQDVRVTGFVDGETRKLTITIYNGDTIALVRLGS